MEHTTIGIIHLPRPERWQSVRERGTLALRKWRV